MAIAVKGAPTGGIAAGANSVTTSITVHASADFIIVGASASNSVGRTISGITYAGVAMTRVPNCTVNRAGGHGTINADLFYLAAPATGANNLVTTINNVADELHHILSGWSGVDQTGPVVNGTNSNSAASPLTCAVTNPDGNVALGYAWVGMGNVLNLTPADTELFEQDSNVTSSMVYSLGVDQLLSWTNANPSKENVIAACSIVPAAPPVVADAAGGYGGYRKIQPLER